MSTDAYDASVRGTGTEDARGRSGAGRDDESVGALLRQLGQESASLVSKEVALLKAEASESARGVGIGMAAMATAGAVMMAGLVILLLGVTYLLGEVIALWLAALIVGAAALLVGWLMVAGAKKKFEIDALKPQRTIDSLRKDKDLATGRTE